MTDLFLESEFDYPVLIDTNDAINRLNHFPTEQQFQCFLLDADNKVIAIGNPTLDIQVREFFRSKIEGRDISETRIVTSVSTDKVMHYYGTIQKDSTHFADFTFTNTGDNPFVITRVAVACGCTDVTWDRQPITPGQTTIVRVGITLEELGPFNKTVVVYGNANDSPIRLTLTGKII